MKWILIILPFIVLGCSQKNQTEEKILLPVELKPLAEIQMHSVVSQMSTGQLSLNALGSMQQFNIPLYNFKGQKTHWLHILSPQQVDLQHVNLQKISGSLSLMGATNLSVPVVFHENSLELLVRFQKLTHKYGVANIQSWHVSPKLEFFALLKSKKFISVESLSPLSPSDVIDQINTSNEREKFLNQQRMREYIATLWRRGGEVHAHSIDSSLVDSKTGELNLDSLIRTHGIDLDQLGDGYDVKSFDETQDKSCFWNQCWDSRAKGKLNERYLEMSGGFAQFPTDYGLRRSITQLPHCKWAPFNSKPPTYSWSNQPIYPLGCGPSAMASLVDWWWRYKGLVVRGKRYNDQPAVYRLSEEGHLTSSRPIDSDSIWNDFFEVDSGGRSTLAEIFGSCYLYAGTFTFPNQLELQAPRFLNWAGLDGSVRLSSIYNYFAGNALPFLNNTQRMAAHLREQIGSKNLPVIAMYPFGQMQMHYSPILEYDIAYKLGYTVIMVRPLDQPERWVNLTDPWNLAAGVFSLQLK